MIWFSRRKLDKAKEQEKESEELLKYVNSLKPKINSQKKQIDRIVEKNNLALAFRKALGG